jgi:hypothetical protein
MKRSFYITILLATLGAGAAAASERCSVPMSDWQPREALQKKLEDEGWKVSRIKTDDGCYEVKATDKEGRRVEASYNPKTFEQVKFELED